MTASGATPAGSTTAVAALGLQVQPPRGFDVSIYRRPAVDGQQTYAVLHAATVPLPINRGDYGAGVVEALGPDDVFVSLLEFGPGSVGTPLFRTVTGVPGLTPSSFRPTQLQRIIQGQGGVQMFFSLNGRAFCLYSVIGAMTNRIALTTRANQVIAGLRIDRS